MFNEDHDKYFKQLNEKIIAVDFDDTITQPRPYPEKAPLDPEAREYLLKLHQAGFRLILWSARGKSHYDEALDRCHNEFDMKFIESDSVDLSHGKTGKLVASFYIDDKSSFGKVEWEKIYNFLMNKYN